MLLFRAEVLTELGRHEECEADVREVLRISGQLGDPGQMIAYAHWMRLESRSARGDGSAALESARETERHTGDWWQVGGADFLADAADCLDRVGFAALAWEYLLRAKETPGDAQPLIAMAECALLARHGDPELAQVRLAEVAQPGHRAAGALAGDAVRGLRGVATRRSTMPARSRLGRSSRRPDSANRSCR